MQKCSIDCSSLKIHSRPGASSWRVVRPQVGYRTDYFPMPNFKFLGGYISTSGGWYGPRSATGPTISPCPISNSWEDTSLPLCIICLFQLDIPLATDIAANGVDLSGSESRYRHAGTCLILYLLVQEWESRAAVAEWKQLLQMLQ